MWASWEAFQRPWQFAAAPVCTLALLSDTATLASCKHLPPVPPQANVADEASAKAAAGLMELPPHYRHFYARRLISALSKQLLGSSVAQQRGL